MSFSEKNDTEIILAVRFLGLGCLVFCRWIDATAVSRQNRQCTPRNADEDAPLLP